jgi:hypothetical protein
MYSVPRRADELREHSFSDILPYIDLLTQEEQAVFIRSATIVNQAVAKHRPQLADGSTFFTEDTDKAWLGGSKGRLL